MKKPMRMLLSILLAAALALPLAACKKKAPTATTGAPTAAPTETKEYRKDSIVGKWIGTMDFTDIIAMDFPVYAELSWEFREDGSFSYTIQGDSLIRSMEENGGEVLELMAAESGMSVSDLLDNLKTLWGAGDTKAEGTYVFENGKLYLDGVVCEEYDFSERGLTFLWNGSAVALIR